MIITAEEYRNMGFDWEDDDELNSALKRAEYVIFGLTDGRALSAIAAGGKAEQYVKQAAAFQTRMILEREFSEESDSGYDSTEERVSIGDFSYTSSKSDSRSDTITPFDTSLTIIHLLQTAGCLYSAAEVAE